MMKAGANRVITPKQIAGRRMAASVLRPQVVNFLEVAVDSGEVAMRIEEFLVSEASPLQGKPSGTPISARTPALSSWPL